MGWVEEKLALAERNGESVLFINHFPTNSRFLVKGTIFVSNATW